MKQKKVEFKSIEFDEIEGDTGLTHHEYKYDKCPAGDTLSWFKDGKLQTVYSGQTMKAKIKELIN